MRFLSTESIRSLDMIAQDRFSIPGILLMEHASLGLAQVVNSQIDSTGHKIIILCGKGNNGGDGFAAARHLHNYGASPEVVLLGRIPDLKAGSDAATNARIAERMGLPIHECPQGKGAMEVLKRSAGAIHLDAVFGTGLNSPLRGIYPALFEEINGLGRPWIAVDVPSGLNSDTGMPMGAAIKAQKTVTFAFAKRGFELGEGPAYCGEIVVVGIGLPREVEEDPEAYLE